MKLTLLKRVQVCELRGPGYHIIYLDRNLYQVDVDREVSARLAYVGDVTCIAPQSRRLYSYIVKVAPGYSLDDIRRSIIDQI